MLIRALAVAVVAGVSLACARIESPPGGPPDAVPPRLIAVAPDSFAVLPGFDGEVEFRFDEVISEGSAPNAGTGTGDLERLILLSPTDRVPAVRWRRDRITVRPREGWRPNTLYRVELLPGVMDLRNNRSDRATRVLTFVTGGSMPRDTLRVVLMDWSTGRPAAGALVEAFLLPDSLRYRFATDSSGRLEATPVMGGTYLVYGVNDANRNTRREPREAFDSATIATGAPSRALWAFAHDTLPPRVREARARDSLAVTITFSMQLDPAQEYAASQVRLWRVDDSLSVRVQALSREDVADSLARIVDTAAAAPVRADSVGLERKAIPGGVRRALSDRLLLQVAAPLDTSRLYAFTISGVRSVSGVTADVEGRFAGPAPRAVSPADTAAVRADSVGARPDSLRRSPIFDPAALPRRP